MATFFLTLVITLASIVALAAGVLLGRSPLRGSCGGVAAPGHKPCTACESHRAAEHAP